MVTISDCISSSWKIRSIPIDNLIFRLHYRGTFILLLFFSVLIALIEYLKGPIKCNENHLMLTSCYFFGVYTTEVESFLRDRGEKKFVTYCAWSFFVLFFQAFPFYFPYFLWKNREGGKQQSLLMQHHLPPTRSINQSGLLAKLVGNRVGIYLYTFIHGIGWYAFAFFACEVLNFINVVLQIFFVDRFLKGQFLDFGPTVINYFSSQNQTEIENPMFDVFPVLVKCEYERVGPSGVPQRMGDMCSLQITPYLALIYLLLWFWFVILAALSGLVLLYRVYILCPFLRFWILLWHCPNVDPSKLESILNNGNIGDWLLLNRLCKNMDQSQFCNLVDSLYNQIQDVYSEMNVSEGAKSHDAVNYVFVNSHVNQVTSTVALSRWNSDPQLHKRIKTFNGED